MLESPRCRIVSRLLPAALSGLLLLAPLPASAAEPGVAPVGPLLATVPAGWQISANPQIAVGLLAQEGNQNPLELVLSGPGEALVYATHGEYPDFAITAQAILDTPLPPLLTNSYGVDPARMSSHLQPLQVRGLDAMVLTASGSGSGRDFLTRKDVPTVAVWIDIPAIYRIGSEPRVRSGISSLYFRAPKSSADSGEFERFQEMVSSLQLREGYTLATIEEFDRQRQVEVVAEDPKTAAPAVATAPAPSSLSTWVDALSSLDARAELPVAERLTRLQPLASALPANLFLEQRLSRLRAEVAESTWVRQFLSDDVDGSKAKALRELHRAILAHVRRESGIEAVDPYLAYLSRVWPDHRLAEPPTQEARQGDRWTNPYLGLEMVRVTPREGRPFWISTRPLLGFLRGQLAGEWQLPDSPTGQQAAELAARFSASIPTLSEYRTSAGALAPGSSRARELWADRSEDAGKYMAVKVEGAGASVSKRQPRGGFLRGGDFHLVLR